MEGTFYNTQREKNTILLNGAGTDTNNPILEGLPFTLEVRFSRVIGDVLALVGATSPPPLTLGSIVFFTQDPSNPYLWTYSGVAGTAPFTVGKKYVRILPFSTEDASLWEKEMHIVAMPSNAVEVWDIQTGTWRTAQDSGNIPQCAQMCGIRFFPDWVDDFNVPRFGGSLYVSIYDYNTAEGDVAVEYVRRDLKKDITRMEHIYLNKHVPDVAELHQFKALFRSSLNGVGVSVNCAAWSPACFGFNIKDPYIYP